MLRFARRIPRGPAAAAASVAALLIPAGRARAFVTFPRTTFASTSVHGLGPIPFSVHPGHVALFKATDSIALRKSALRKRKNSASLSMAAGSFLVPIEGLQNLLAGAAVVLAVPYLAFLVLLYNFQRSIVYPKPQVLADPAIAGAKLCLLPAGEALTKFADASGGAGSDTEAVVAAIHFPAKNSDMPTLVYCHGNADQIGWGAAYLGRELSERYGFGFFGIEYPGYGLSNGLETTEESIYEGSLQLMQHLTSPKGLAVPNDKVVLLGQSIGCAVAIEMASRGFGQRMVLLAPFASIPRMASAAFPLVKPALQLLPWLVRDVFDNTGKADQVAMPTMVLHGSVDEIVPQEQGRELAAVLGDCRFVDVRGAGHNDLFASEHEDFVFEHIGRFARS